MHLHIHEFTRTKINSTYADTKFCKSGDIGGKNVWRVFLSPKTDKWKTLMIFHFAVYVYCKTGERNLWRVTASDSSTFSPRQTFQVYRTYKYYVHLFVS
jgi:hypothetical protein